MSINEALTVASSEVVFSVLFILGLFIVGRVVMSSLKDIRAENNDREAQIAELYKQQMERADKREADLMDHLGQTTKQMGNIAETLKDVQLGLDRLEDRMDKNVVEIWKELGAKEDKRRGGS